AAVAGVATFSTLSIDKTGVGYTLSATDGALGAATSAPFNITPAAAHHLAFGQQPLNGATNTPLNPAVTIKILDQFGNVVTTDTSHVILALGNNPSGATLGGATDVAAVNGVATFSDLTIDNVGQGYTLVASDGALIGATSNGFNISPATALFHLAFSQQPTNTVAGVAISPALTVQVLDQFGNLITSDNTSVSIVISTNPGGGVLSGTTTVPVINGIATFSDLSINKVGVAYRLTALDGPYAAAASNTFNITAAAADHLAFGVQPTTTLAGTAITPAITVQVLDAFGTLVTTDTSNVTVATGATPGSGTLSGTTTVAASGGIATFSTLAIDKVGTGYTLTASRAGLGVGSSNSFNITPAAADHLAFGVQPSNTVAGVAISPAVTVRVLDAFGNLVTSDTSNVIVAIG